jgi:hypothetical protein
MLVHPNERKRKPLSKREPGKRKTRQAPFDDNTTRDWADDFEHLESWRDIAAEAHRIWKEEGTGLEGVGGSSSSSYFYAVQKGFKGHQGEWGRIVRNIGAEGPKSKVPGKILKKGD